MLLSYVPGGELFSHLRRAGRFSADVTRFYLASIILAIENLHSRNIIYRDLKPENLLLDRAGYLRIADFGFAKIVEDRTFTLCGTPEYLAPEIVLSQGHGKAVDYWALGILAFEMLAGYPPFFDDHPLGIYEKILRNEVAFPAHIDMYAKDLIRGLLTTDRSKRLGNLRGGAKDIMEHAWFSGVDWGSLERKEIGAPIVPRVVNMGEHLYVPLPSYDKTKADLVQVIHKTFSDIHHPDLVNCRESLVKSTTMIWINLEVCSWTLRIHQVRSSRVEQGRACHHQRVWARVRESRH
jgi:protein kinase A